MRDEIREKVYEAIDTERNYQDSQRKAGRFTELVLPIAGELECIRHYLNKATTSYAESPGETPHETLETIRKITAMGVRAMEHHGAPIRGTCIN